MLFEYSVDDWVGRREGRSVYPILISFEQADGGIRTDNRNIIVGGQLSGDGCFTVTTSFCSKIDDDRARLHSSDHLFM